jgi:hypothetical protein
VIEQVPEQQEASISVDEGLGLESMLPDVEQHSEQPMVQPHLSPQQDLKQDDRASVMFNLGTQFLHSVVLA